MVSIPKTTVEMSFDGGPGSAPSVRPVAMTWTDVTPWVEGFSFNRGRNSELDRIEAGTLSLSLDNSDGRFTPGRKVLDTNVFQSIYDLIERVDLTGTSGDTPIGTAPNTGITDDQKVRVVSRKVWTNGAPANCYFTIKWTDAIGTVLPSAAPTRFVADGYASVYTHEEAAPAGAAKGEFWLYVDMTDSRTGILVSTSNVTWQQASPYWPGVLPRRRVRVRSGNRVNKNVSTGGDVNRSAFYSTHQAPAGGSIAYVTDVAKSGLGAIKFTWPSAGTGDFAGSGYLGGGGPGTFNIGLADVEGGKRYTSSVYARLDKNSPALTSVKCRMRWYDKDNALISVSSTGSAMPLTIGRSNLVLNPSTAIDLSNTQTYGSGLTRTQVFAEKYVGAGSIEHVYTVAGSAGTTWSIEPKSNLETISISIWVKVPAGFTAGQLAWRSGTTTLGVITGQHNIAKAGTWTKLTGSYTLKAGETCDRIGIAMTGGVSAKWWADAAVAVVGSSSPDYVDGDSADNEWLSTPHASASVPIVWSRPVCNNQLAPAGAVKAIVQFGTSAMAGDVVVYVDEVQLEEGSSAGDWFPGGSLFTGFVERWPVTSDGLMANVEVTAVDGFSVLGTAELREPMAASILGTKPVGYWTLGDPAGATRLENFANDVNPASLVSSKYGGGTPALGAPGLVTRDSGTSYSLTNIASNQGTIVDLTDAGKRPIPLDSQMVFNIWFQPSALPASGDAGNIATLWGDDGRPVMSLNIFSTGKINLFSCWAEEVDSYSFTSDYIVSPSAPVMITILMNSGFAYMYINGALHKTSSGYTPSTPFLRDIKFSAIGGQQNNLYYSNYQNGRYSHVAIWDEYSTNKLLSADFLDWYKLGTDSSYSESETVRIARALEMADWLDETIIDSATTTLAVPEWSEGTDALSVIQSASSDASGYVLIDGDGRVAYHNRVRRQSAAVKHVLGDSTGLPYESDLEFEMDEDSIVNEVTYKRANGAEGVLRDRDSIAAYGRKSQALEMGVASDSVVLDAAYTLLNLYSEPRVKCTKVTLRATATQALFPVILGLEIGDRITLADMPTYAPEPSMDFFVEAISMDVKQDGSSAEWVVDLSLSSADESDVWILEDPSLGRLDTSTVLAY